MHIGPWPPIMRFRNLILKVHSHIAVPYRFRLVRIREKYVTEPDTSERVHCNIWQRYFLALTHTELNGHVTDKREWTFIDNW
jgi:hypothetical protein